MDVIADLIEKRKDLFKQVEAIDTVLNIYGYNESTNHTNQNVEDLTNAELFPLKVSLDKQIFWIFENSGGRALKLTELQNIFNQYIGKTNIKISNKARQLKKDGKLVLVKYDGKNILSFWGLPSWIEENDYKVEHRPSEDKLPYYSSSEVFTS